MDLSKQLEQVLSNPSPAEIAQLQPALLSVDNPSAQATLRVAGIFYRYMVAVRAQADAKQFPIIATALSATSTGISIGQDVFSPDPTPTMHVALDTLRTTLDVIGTYQFVRQWEPAFQAVHDSAVWELYDAYWQMSQDLQPDLSIEKRVALLETLFQPVRNQESDGRLRLAWMVTLFQWALVARMASLLKKPA